MGNADAGELLHHMRTLGHHLKHALRDGNPTRRKGKSVQCYLPAEFVEDIAERCDNLTRMAEAMRIMPSLSEPDHGLQPLHRGIDHVIGLYYQCKTSPWRKTTGVTFDQKASAMLEPLEAAEQNLMDAIEGFYVSPSDDGRVLRSYCEIGPAETRGQSRRSDSRSPELKACEHMAYLMYGLACRELSDGVRLPKDREAYRWLKEHDALVSKHRYELPDFETWARYVRAARKRHGDQKNTPPGHTKLLARKRRGIVEG